MSWIFLEPSDVLFFRNAKPFSAGSDHHSSSLFPPFPTTVAGAIRSKILGQENIDLSKFKNLDEKEELFERIGSPNSLGGFSMLGPYFAVYDAKRLTAEIRYPFPADCYQIDKDGKILYQTLKPIQETITETDWDGENLFFLGAPNDERHDSQENVGWLDPVQFGEYLKGNFFACNNESLIFNEPRIGHGMDYLKRAVKKQMFFDTSYIRLKTSQRFQHGLLVNVSENSKFPLDTGWLSLGGENRSVKHIFIEEKNVKKASDIRGSNFVKIILTTPAFLSGGWRPLDGKWEKILGTKKTPKLISVALKKPDFIGGWDLAKKGHKVMLTYVPAGSVYYFQLEDELTKRKGFTESPNGMDFENLGFGDFITGSWQWQSMK